MPDESVLSGAVTVDVSAVWQWIVGGGFAGLGLGAGGYHIARRATSQGSNARSDGGYPECPIDGRLDALDRLVTAIDSLVAENREANTEFHVFCQGVVRDHKDQFRLQQQVVDVTQKQNETLAVLASKM